jgi:hypothetical protein
MIAAFRDLAAHASDDVARGWRADGRALMTGILTALAVSAPLIVLLSLTPAGPFGAMAVGVTVQMVLGWAIAGREMRCNR